MTVDNAIKHCNGIISKHNATLESGRSETTRNNHQYLIDLEQIKLAALMKQKSNAIKIVSATSDSPQARCTACNEIIHTSFMDSNYCHWCGQKLGGYQ